MERLSIAPRANWKARCEEMGFNFYDLYGYEYWREGTCYRFTLLEIEAIETASEELHAMCLDLIADVVKKGDYEGYNFSDSAKALAEKSWQRGDPYLYGRFDLAYNGTQLKLLEYNADTPTALVEASTAQWAWLEDNRLTAPDQYNSIYPKLIERWKEIRGKFPVDMRLYFTCMQEGAAVDDYPTVNFLMDTAVQAGYDCSWIDLEHIVWDSTYFQDVNGNPIQALFKLYPWEWMLKDEFGAYVPQARTQFLEPAWKMLLSNKAILPLLWARHPEHPLLLPAHFASQPKSNLLDDWVVKPLLGREGENVKIIDSFGRTMEQKHINPTYEGPTVWQKYFRIPQFDGRTPIIGAWMIGDKPAGMGIREDSGLITTGVTNSFIPHYFIS